MTRRLTLQLAALVAMAACARVPARPVASSPDPAPQIVVVRHAEKAPTPVDDQALSALGLTRAAALDAALRSVRVTDVVVSQLQRTRLTASVLVARTGARVHVVPITAAGAAVHVRAVADTVRAIMQQNGQGSVLVVGHSNTVTQIVEALGGPRFAALCDSQYSQVFVLRPATDGVMTVERATYGAADPADPTCAGMSPGR